MKKYLRLINRLDVTGQIKARIKEDKQHKNGTHSITIFLTIEQYHNGIIIDTESEKNDEKPEVE